MNERREKCQSYDREVIEMKFSEETLSTDPLDIRDVYSLIRLFFPPIKQS